MSIQLNKKRINCNCNVRCSHPGTGLITSNVEQLGFFSLQFTSFSLIISSLESNRNFHLLCLENTTGLFRNIQFCHEFFSHDVLFIKCSVNNMINRNNMIIKIILTIWYQVGPPGFKNQIQPKDPPSIVWTTKSMYEQ